MTAMVLERPRTPLVLVERADPVAPAPLLCAGFIGWRSLKRRARHCRLRQVKAAGRPLR